MSFANLSLVFPLNTELPTNLNVLLVMLYLSFFSLTSLMICPNSELVNRNLSNLVKPVMPAPNPFLGSCRPKHSPRSRPCIPHRTPEPLCPCTSRHRHHLQMLLRSRLLCEDLHEGSVD